MRREDLNSTFVCPECAYTSAGVQSIKCPECGYEGPGETLQERLTRSYIAAGVLGLSFVVAGAASMVAALFCAMTIEYNNPVRPITNALWVIGLVCMGCAPVGVVGVLLGRKRLARQPKEKRQHLLLLCLVPGLLGSMLFIVCVLGLLFLVLYLVS